MLIRNYFLTILFVFVVGLAESLAGNGDELEPETPSELKSSETTAGVPYSLSIKLMPAFYWGTFGVQVEYPLTNKISIGLMTMIKKSDSKNYILHPEDYQNGGFLVDIYAKYFLVGDAPEGLYGLANLSYNSMLYYDGNTRPYSLKNRWKDFEGFRLPNSIQQPKAINAGLGVGYQLIIVPKHVIADVFIAASGNFDHTNSFFIQLYLAPSIGFVF